MVEIEPYTFETYWLLLLLCPCTTPTKSVDQTVSHSTFWPVSCCADPLTSRVRLPWQPGPQVGVFPKYIGIGILNMQYEKNR